VSGERVVPQLSDPLVRRMADRDHVPREMWAMGGHLISLHCDACGQSWPCETRRALEAFKGS
jgi:hypothetical protein